MSAQWYAAVAAACVPGESVAVFAGLLPARVLAASAEAVVFVAAVVVVILSAVVAAFAARRVEVLVPLWLVGFASVVGVAAASDVAESVVAKAAAALLFVLAAFVVGVAAFPAAVAVARAASSADRAVVIVVDFASVIAAVEGHL